MDCIEPGLGSRTEYQWSERAFGRIPTKHPQQKQLGRRNPHSTHTQTHQWKFQDVYIMEHPRGRGYQISPKCRSQDSDELEGERGFSRWRHPTAGEKRLCPFSVNLFSLHKTLYKNGSVHNLTYSLWKNPSVRPSGLAGPTGLVSLMTRRVARVGRKSGSSGGAQAEELKT